MATISNKILTGSPFKVGNNTDGITKAVLNIWIYTGTQGSAVSAGNDARLTGDSFDRVAEDTSYELTSTAVGYSDSKYVSFEISNLIQSYIAQTFNGDENESRSNSIVWVDYQLITTINTVDNIEALTQCLALDGYTYFEDGPNAQYLDNVLTSSDIITRLQDNPVFIGLDSASTSVISYFSNERLLNTRVIPSSNESHEQVYYASNSYNDAEQFKNRVEAAGGTYEEGCNEVSFECEVDVFDCDTAYVEGTDGSVKVLKIQTLEENNNPSYKVSFINMNGVVESMWFYGKNTNTINNKSNTYGRNISSSINGKDFNTNAGSIYKQRVSSRRGMVLNSGFHPEESNSTFEQLIDSKDVWIDVDGKVLPIIVTTSSLNVKSELNDNAINYTINVDFAFNKINDI